LRRAFSPIGARRLSSVGGAFHPRERAFLRSAEASGYKPRHEQPGTRGARA
jgi:hypothetical protein